MENSGAIQNQGSLENTGSGRLENIGENAAISGNKPTGDNADVTYQFISARLIIHWGHKKGRRLYPERFDRPVCRFLYRRRQADEGYRLYREGRQRDSHGEGVVMEKLSTGSSHTLKAVYTLGEATGAISVEKQTQEPAAPSTPTPAPERPTPKQALRPETVRKTIKTTAGRHGPPWFLCGACICAACLLRRHNS